VTFTVASVAAGADVAAGAAAAGAGLVDADGVVGFPPELQLITPNAAAMSRNGSARRDRRRVDMRDMKFFSFRDSHSKATRRTGL
jgi:hypothetical protein